MPTAQLSEVVCHLPGGLVLDDGQRLRRAALRPLTGHEEEWVAQHPDAPSAQLVTGLLSACFLKLDDVAVEPGLVRQMLVGDRDFLILQLRRLSLGERFAAVLACPACAAKMDVEFLAHDVLVEPRPQSAAVYTWRSEQRPADLPAVRFRLPNGGDQEAVAESPVDEAVELLLARCLLDDGGVPLTADERVALIAEMERLAPQVDLELALSCPECSHSFTTAFDTTAFFFAEIRAQSRQLLREVHHLALHYHWSETDILNLRRERRRAYLALLNETLRPA
jgi:hypothetical protein